MPFLDEIDEWAAPRRPGRSIPSSTATDASSVTTRMATGSCGRCANREVLEPAGKSTLILGAGGSARGVVQALLRAAVGPLTVANRTLSRAESLVELAVLGA